MTDNTHARNKRVEKVAGIINGLLNPLLLCAFLPILEGHTEIDFISPTGFWGQLIVAVVIAELVGSLPIFGRAVQLAVDHFDAAGKPIGKIIGTMVGATMLFCIIGLGESIFTGGIGEVAGRGLFVRWASLLCTGWGLVVIGGLLLDPIAHRIAQSVVR